MKRKILSFIFTLCLILPCAFMLSACDIFKSEEPTEYSITFIVDNQEYSTLKTAGNEAIELPDEPTKVGYTFNGWYLDEDFESLFNDEYYLDKELTKNINIYAKFTINQYTIAFNSNEGSSVAPITQDYNTAVSKPIDPTRDGYTFAGWFTDNGTFNNEYTFTTMPLNGITLYAKWNIETYTITYHLDDGINGSNPASYTINTNDITLEDATKEGYTFNGWYIEQEFDNKIEAIDTSSLQNYDLYAKFTINQYTIAFNSNEGSSVAPITQDYNTAVSKPTDPTRDGYTFAGWFTDNGTFNNEYTFTTMPLNGMTLYAKWNIETYIITYHLDDGTNGENPSIYTILTNDITLEDATKEGHTFNGWYTEQEFANKIEAIDTSSLQNYDLYAKFTIINYTLTIPSNVKVMKGQVELSNEDTLNYGDLIIVTYTETPGYEKTLFAVGGATETSNENEYKVTGNVYTAYSEKIIKYELSLADTAKAMKGNTELQSGDILYYGDIITVTYVEKPGYQMTRLYSFGITATGNPNEYMVIGNELFGVSIMFFEEEIEHTLSIPNNVTVIKEQEVLTNEDTLHYGDIITITYKETLGYEKTEFNVLGATKTSNENEYTVNGNISIVYSEELIEYSLIIPERISVTKNQIQLTNEDIVYYGDTIIINYIASDDFILEEIQVSGATKTSNEDEYIVNDDVEISCIEYEIVDLTVVTNLNTNTYSVKKNDSITQALEYVNVDINDNNSIGFYVDKDLTEPIANTSQITQNMTLYTKIATLEKLIISSSYSVSAISTEIEGDIIIPKSVKTIETFAFTHCKKIKSIFIPSSVTVWGNKGSQVIIDCLNLNTIEVAEDNIYFDSREDCNSVIKTSTNTLIAGCYNSIIPESVVSIGDHAFQGCDKLETMTISNNVTKIGRYAFNGCSLLNSIIIGGKVEIIDSFAFLNCNLLTSVIIGSEVNIIGNYAFSGTNISTINIPARVSTISIGAFAGCSNLNSITVDTNNTSYDSRDNCNAIIKTNTNTLVAGCNSTVIPISVTTIGNGSFIGTAITSFYIHQNITTISSDAFQYNSLLDSIIVDENNTKYDSRDNCNAIIEKGTGRLIVGCKSTVIPTNITIIGTNAFSGSDITTIVIPENILTINAYAFMDCKQLRSINFPSNLTTIGDQAFYNCEKLESISLPSSLHTIGDWAFENCTSLTTVNIPRSNGVTLKIGEDAFNGCVNITEIVIDKLESSSITSSSYGGVMQYVQTIYYKTENVTSGYPIKGTYISKNFTKQETSDKEGYDMYVRNVTE